jgi:phosphoribosylamine--glycine ligase
MTRRRKIVVVGSGGREHALALTLLTAPTVDEVVVTPGNAGTARCTAVPGKVMRNAKGRPLDVAIAEKPDLVVVGPEVPLCEGLVDALSAQDIFAYGPSRRAARLEGSKVYMKDMVSRLGLPTAKHVVITEAAGLEQAVAQFEQPPVVKADGLCAGKGVFVTTSHQQAVREAERLLSGQAFGDAGRTVVLEERLQGQEVSIHAICDGQRAFVLPAVQDHKRVYEGDQGPNTGGMGAYGPAPVVTAQLLSRVENQIINRVLEGMRADGCPFRGTLFAGLMVTERGEPNVLEFNVRFGDPETQVLMNLLEGDLCELLLTAARGNLDAGAVSIADRHALCVVLAASGYPGAVRTGDAVMGLSDAQSQPQVRVYHAGTGLDGDRVVTSGGRVLGVTGVGSTLSEAAHRAYAALESISFEGQHFRRDIGHRAL